MNTTSILNPSGTKNGNTMNFSTTFSPLHSGSSSDRNRNNATTPKAQGKVPMAVGASASVSNAHLTNTEVSSTVYATVDQNDQRALQDIKSAIVCGIETVRVNAQGASVKAVEQLVAEHHRPVLDLFYRRTGMCKTAEVVSQVRKALSHEYNDEDDDELVDDDDDDEEDDLDNDDEEEEDLDDDEEEEEEEELGIRRENRKRKKFKGGKSLKKVKYEKKKVILFYQHDCVREELSRVLSESNYINIKGSNTNRDCELLAKMKNHVNETQVAFIQFRALSTGLASKGVCASVGIFAEMSWCPKTMTRARAFVRKSVNIIADQTCDDYLWIVSSGMRLSKPDVQFLYPFSGISSPSSASSNSVPKPVPRVLQSGCHSPGTEVLQQMNANIIMNNLYSRRHVEKKMVGACEDADNMNNTLGDDDGGSLNRYVSDGAAVLDTNVAAHDKSRADHSATSDVRNDIDALVNLNTGMDVTGHAANGDGVENEASPIPTVQKNALVNLTTDMELENQVVNHNGCDGAKSTILDVANGAEQMHLENQVVNHNDMYQEDHVVDDEQVANGVEQGTVAGMAGGANMYQEDPVVDVANGAEQGTVAGMDVTEDDSESDYVLTYSLAQSDPDSQDEYDWNMHPEVPVVNNNDVCSSNNGDESEATTDNVYNCYNFDSPRATDTP